LIIDKHKDIACGASGSAGAFLSPLLGKENNFKNLVTNASIHLTTYYKNNFKLSNLPVTEKISDQILSLPLYPNMTNKEKDYLVNSISEFFASYITNNK